MYRYFYGINDFPFGACPDPRFLYKMPHVQEALACLQYGIASRKGFVVMTGEVGTGKTTLLKTVLSSFTERRISTAFVFNPRLETLDFLEFVLEDFGIPTNPRNKPDLPVTKSGMLMQLNRWLIDRFRNGELCAIVVDEAQNLSWDLLEEIRLLTNLETSSEKLVQIILSGQPELEEKLRDPSVRQLRQRISTVCHIQSLSVEETVGYIDYRVKMAGYLGQPLFTAGAVRLIAEASHGTPRTINNLCFNALALCCKMKLRQVDAAMVAKAIAGLQLIPQSSATIAAVPAVPIAAAPERPSDSNAYIGLRLIPSSRQSAAPADAPFAVASSESPDQPAEPKFWVRTKLRLMHLLPATAGSVMLWVPSAAIILVATFLGVLRLTELWAPQTYLTSPHSTAIDQSTVLDAPPPAPAPDTDEPAATESASPSDPGSPVDKPVSAPAASTRHLQASASIPKPSPAIASPASTSRPLHANASNPKPAAAIIHPSASTAKEPLASKEPSASNSTERSVSIPMPSAVAQPVVTPAAQHSSTPAAPAATAPKQVRAALTSNAPVAAQPSALPSVRPALPPIAP